MANWSKKLEDNVPVGRGRLRKLLPSGVWHFHFRSEHGKWVSRATRHRDRAGAIRWAEAFSMNLTRTEFNPTPTAIPVKAPTVVRAIVTWLRYQRQQNTSNTYRSYRTIALKFWRFLKSRGITRFAELTRDVMLTFRTWCLARKNRKVTVDNNLIALRSFFSWAVSKKWITTNPASQTRHGERLFFDEVPVRKDTYTRVEYERIIKAATGDARLVFTLLGSWGLRISELAMLEWSDIDRASGWVHVRNKITHDGMAYRPKDKTDRKLPLEGRQVLAAIDELATRSSKQGFVLPLGRVKSRPAVVERRFIKHLKGLSEATGIPAERLTLHRFRNYFVCECAENSVPMPTVMEWVGHDEMSMVMHYYTLRDHSARGAMRRLSDSMASATDGATEKDDGAASSPSSELSEAASKLGSENGRGVPVNESSLPPNRAAHLKKSHGKRSDVSRPFRTAQRRTSVDTLDYLWIESQKPASRRRKRGKTERGGFEPPEQVITRSTV